MGLPGQAGDTVACEKVPGVAVGADQQMRAVVHPFVRRLVMERAGATAQTGGGLEQFGIDAVFGEVQGTAEAGQTAADHRHRLHDQ